MKQSIKKMGLLAGLLGSCQLNLVAKEQALENKAPAAIPQMKKIFTVNLADVYDHFYKGKEARESFETLAKNAQTEIEKMMEEGRAIIEKIQALQKKLGNPALDQAAKEKLTTELEAEGDSLRKKEIQINTFRQEKDEKLSQQRQAVLSEHFKEISQQIAELARAKKADFVFNSAGMGVLYSNPEHDLTQEVIQLVNKGHLETTKTNGKEKPKAASKKD